MESFGKAKKMSLLSNKTGETHSKNNTASHSRLPASHSRLPTLVSLPAACHRLLPALTNLLLTCLNLLPTYVSLLPTCVSLPPTFASLLSASHKRGVTCPNYSFACLSLSVASLNFSFACTNYSFTSPNFSLTSPSLRLFLSPVIKYLLNEKQILSKDNKISLILNNIFSNDRIYHRKDGLSVINANV